MADQGPDINTSVSPETISGASPKPPSPEQEAAKTEAAGLREAEKRGGAGEALQKLSLGDKVAKKLMELNYGMPPGPPAFNPHVPHPEAARLGVEPQYHLQPYKDLGVDTNVSIADETKGWTVESKNAGEAPIRFGNATWKNKDSDVQVEITGDLGIGGDGRRYVSIEGSTTGIPLDEIQYPQETTRELDATEKRVINDYVNRIVKGELDDDIVSKLDPSWREEIARRVSAEREAANAAVGGGGAEGGEPPAPPEPPDQPEPREEPPDDQITPVGLAEDINEKARKQAEAARDRREALSADSLEDIEDKIAFEESRRSDASETLRTSRLPAETHEEARGIRADADQKLEDLREARRQKKHETRSGGRQEDWDIARREMRERREYAEKIADFTPEQRGQERAKLAAAEKNFDETLTESLTPVERAVAQRELGNIKARKKALEEIETTKGPEEERKKTEDEAKETSKKLEQKRRETATVANLQTAVSKDDIVVNTLIKRINALDTRIAQSTGKDKVNLEKERANLAKEELTARETLEADKEALKLAQERARNEKGLGQTRSEETVRVLTQAEFDQLDADGKAKYFIEVSDAVKSPLSGELQAIRQKLMRGENLTFKEAGQLVRSVSDSLFEKGRTKESLQLLDLALKSQPEMARAILDRVSQKDEVKKAMDEMYPGMGKKMWDFARKHPGWLSIILAIIAAGATAATVGVAPIVGAGVGAAGVAGGGFGINKKSRW